MAGLLYGRGYSALMPGARAGLAARPDLAVFGDILPKQVGLLVINSQSLVCAELTKFGLGKEAALTATF
jgi:hypothetical protein